MLQQDPPVPYARMAGDAGRELARLTVRRLAGRCRTEPGVAPALVRRGGTTDASLVRRESDLSGLKEGVCERPDRWVCLCVIDPTSCRPSQQAAETRRSAGAQRDDSPHTPRTFSIPSKASSDDILASRRLICSKSLVLPKSLRYAWAAVPGRFPVTVLRRPDIADWLRTPPALGVVSSLPKLRRLAAAVNRRMPKSSAAPKSVRTGVDIVCGGTIVAEPDMVAWLGRWTR